MILDIGEIFLSINNQNYGEDQIGTEVTDKYYTTPAGFRRFLERMKSVASQYDAVVASNEDAADSGDNSVWHDNFAYEDNQRKMHQWAHQFHKLEVLKSKLVVIDLDPDPIQVKLGCEVIVYDMAEDSEKKYIIAGYEDGDPERNRISYTSPIAKAILGAKEGDLKKLKIKDKIKEFEILGINALKEEYV